MNDSHKLFKKLKQDAEDNSSNRDTGKFEEAVVAKLLQLSSSQLQLPALKRHQQNLTGSPRVAFAEFATVFPSYPVRLAASTNRYSGKLPYASLLGGKLSKLKLIDEYAKVASEHEINVKAVRFGLVFRCSWAKQASIQVMHNQVSQTGMPDFDTEPEEVQETLCRRFMFWFRGTYYVLEGLRSFTHTVGTDWASNANLQ